MPETTTQPVQAVPNNLFPTVWADTGLAGSPLSGWLPGVDMSQSEKDAIMRQIHPIFLTTHSEEKAPVLQGNFDKFLGFLRLCLEWFLKLVDIIVDAAIQIARLFVWVIAIIGVLIVVTLMTNTTDKFIDILNSSIFPIIGLETKIQKVGPTTPIVSNQNNLESSTVVKDTNTPETTDTSADNSVTDAAETARLELIKARRARLSAQ
jgi:hypothetical protein